MIFAILGLKAFVRFIGESFCSRKLEMFLGSLWFFSHPHTAFIKAILHAFLVLFFEPYETRILFNLSLIHI